MVIDFFKYHGSGNDFIIIEDLNSRFKNTALHKRSAISKLCNRHFGIGADGLILLQKSRSADFKMKYYNSDGKEGSLCGNGARCIAAFAYNSGIVSDSIVFEAIDGKHFAEIIKNKNGINVKVKMQDITAYQKIGNSYYLDTGSPHFVKFVKDINAVDVVKSGSKIRNSEQFQPHGTNVNYVESKSDGIFVRTYERGVENETLSCGTGVVAAAISTFLKDFKKKKYKIYTRGGNLSVEFKSDPDSSKIENIWLSGPAQFVFKGELTI